MKRLLSLVLSLACFLCLTGCGGESFDFKNNYENACYTGEPYSADDITLSILSVDSENGTLTLKVENLSEHTLTYGNPFFSFAVKNRDSFMRLSHEYWQRQGINLVYTAEAYTLAPGEAVETHENGFSVECDLEALLPGYTYQVRFEFFFSSINPEADESGNFRDTMHRYYITRDFTVD